MWTGNQVTVSMRVMSAGTGYRYLLKSVVAADGDRALSTPLTRYYTQTGTPPGFWLGSGVNGLGDGALQPGDEVTEDQLRLLMGEGRDPVTGAALGRAFPEYKSRAERIRIRVDALNPWMPEAERITAVAAIEAEESDRRVRRAVAGFDFTFSAPKSVSVLWGLVDPDTRTAVVAAHHAAVADVIGLMEREVAATRTGAASTDGAVAQVAVEGLIATAYDHFDSRAGDPQLHTHVVISNKVKTVLDRKWRSLDGRPLHASVVAMSELYNSVLADHLSRSLGVQWEARERGRDRNPAWEIAGIPHELIDLFSSRSHAIEVEIAQLVADYRERHGSGPAPATMIKLREQATLATRPYKNMRPLDELTRSWRATAKPVLSQFSAALRAVMGDGGNQRADGVSGVLGWVRDGVRTSPFPSQGRQLVSAEDLLEPVIDRFGQRVVQTVGDKRSTWRRWNLHAEASRQTMGLRFASTADRETVIGRIVAAAEGASVRLTPPDLASIPAQFRRPDGSSVFRPKHSTVFTSAGLLAAEDRLLQLGRATGGVTVPIRNLDFAARGANRPGVDLSDDQVAALIAVGTSGRALDVLVGPAGAGKTTAMQALRSAWELTHGPGSVIGLAPSAAAAQLLADDLGIATENTAKWLHDHTTTGQYFLSSQLVIIDEASLAGTHTLDQITSRAATVGAKVLLVGDWAQLAAINAGGAFGLLVRDRDEPPELPTSTASTTTGRNGPHSSSATATPM